MSYLQECCVLNCGKTKLATPSTRFFAIPKDECTSVTWLRRAGIDPLGPHLAAKRQFVCEDHFDEEDMLIIKKGNSIRNMLKRDILPHKKLPFHKGVIKYGYMVENEEDSVQVGSIPDPDPAPASPPHIEPEPETPQPITEKCRLCFQTDPKSQLGDIFSSGSDRRQRIQKAVSIKVSETDCTTLICRNCARMVDIIIAFQQICQRSNSILCETSKLTGGSWIEFTVMIDYFHETIKQHRQDLFGALSDDAFEEIVVECSLPPGIEAKEEPPTNVDNSEREFTPPVIEESDFLTEVENVDAKSISKMEIEPDESANIDEHDSEALPEVKPIEQPKPAEESPSEDEWDSSEDDEEQSDAEPGLERDDQMWQPSESDDDDSSSAEEDKPRKALLRKKSARRKPDPNKWKWKKPEEKIMCDTCGQLVSKYRMDAHNNRHLGVKPYICKVEGCDYSAYATDRLKRHKRNHVDENKYFTCKQCEKQVKGRLHFIRHQESHDPQYMCDVCGKKFRIRAYLKNHEVVHTKAANYPCEICGKRFGIKHNLIPHYRIHEKRGEFRPTNRDQEQQSALNHLE